MVFTLFKKLPPSISVPIFYWYVAGQLLLRFLFATTYGAFVLVLFLYAYVYYFTSIKPFSILELMSWIDTLSPSYKVSLVTSLVTIAGFIIAFHAASLNWQHQMRAQLKAQVSGEIENFFATVNRKINEASVYVNSLVKVASEIQDGCDAEDATFSIGRLQSQAKEFYAIRDLLSQASIEVYRLIGRNSSLLLSAWGLYEGAQIAAKSLTDVANKMWVHIPVVDVGDPNHIQSFINQINIADCNEFLESCEHNGGKISGISGGIQGHLTSPILGFSMIAFINILLNRKQFREAMQAFHRDLNK